MVDLWWKWMDRLTVYPSVGQKTMENVRDNLFGPVVLALMCKRYNIHFRYLGTGCIFTYDDAHNELVGFTEFDKPNFFGSSYSVVKGFTVRIFHMDEFKDYMLNVRIHGRFRLPKEFHSEDFTL